MLTNANGSSALLIGYSEIELCGGYHILQKFFIKNAFIMPDIGIRY